MFVRSPSQRQIVCSLYFGLLCCFFRLFPFPFLSVQHGPCCPCFALSSMPHFAFLSVSFAGVLETFVACLLSFFLPWRFCWRKATFFFSRGWKNPVAV